MNDVSLFQENALKPRFGREKRNRQAAEQIAINAKCNRHKAFFDIVGLAVLLIKVKYLGVSIAASKTIRIFAIRLCSWRRIPESSSAMPLVLDNGCADP